MNILQTVYNQHSKYCGWKISTNTIYKFRYFPLYTKNDKRQNLVNIVPNIHRAIVIICCKIIISAPPTILCFFSITAIVGIIKEFKPKMIRHITDATIPIMEVIWCSSFNHCSKKITANIAVITKPTPFASYRFHMQNPKIESQ